MVENVDIQTLLKYRKLYPLFDVRSPAEYAKGHIPEALNLALFSNEERAEIGTIYKRESSQKAFLKGLEIIGPKMSQLVEKVINLTSSKTLLVHCWRGGKRSGSFAWLLSMAGYEVKTLIGGYKAYRNYILQQFYKSIPNLIILGGKTGSGKTQILKSLKVKGQQIIDLEGLAHHKGSAFGFIGELPAPTVEQFENNLFTLLSSLYLSKRIWVENESKRIGKVLIPNGFWQQMKQAPLIDIELPFELRLGVSIDNYATKDKLDLSTAFYNIRKRLGSQNYQQALQYLDKEDLKNAARIALNYYDKQYQYMLEKNETTIIKYLKFELSQPNKIADFLIEFAQIHKF